MYIGDAGREGRCVGCVCRKANSRVKVGLALTACNCSRNWTGSACKRKGRGRYRVIVYFRVEFSRNDAATGNVCRSIERTDTTYRWSQCAGSCENPTYWLGQGLAVSVRYRCRKGRRVNGAYGERGRRGERRGAARIGNGALDDRRGFLRWSGRSRNSEG